MRSKKIFVFLAHPDKTGLTGSLADAYEAGAKSAGHEVRRQNIGDMQFDPILHRGYRALQTLEPDLLTFQENTRWAEHLVYLYPNWWSTMPALFKGLIDRVWLPGFAFRFWKTGPLKGYVWDGLLKGKSARVIICANTHPWATWALFGEFTNELSRATLQFAGVHPVKTRVIAPSETKNEKTKERWKRELNALGKRAG